jgi:transcriptional regulator with XRE-family HTH domain
VLAGPSPDVAAARLLFGGRVRMLREVAGLSQEKLAELVGVDRKTINRTENGAHSTDLDSIVAMARALGQPPGELFQW